MPFKIFRLVALMPILFMAHLVSAQQYGFEWIKTYQPYYKFLVGKTATYRIGASALQNAGVNVASINPKRIQLFYQGKEVPIYVAGEADNVFNNNDFIEFVGFKNNGNIDEELYDNNTWQPNKFNGLFTDTSAYFLTILPDTTVQLPLRLVQENDYNFSGLQPELYFTDTVILAPAEEYLDGPDLMNASEKYVSSEYQEGEGWASERIGWFNPRTFVLNTPALHASGPAPTIELKVIGGSNAQVVGQFNHHVQIGLSTDNSSFNTVVDHTYRGYGVVKFNPTISASNIGSITFLKVSTINDLSVASDFNCLSYAFLTYPRTYNLANGSQKVFEVTHQRGGAKSYVQMINVGINSGNAYVYDLTANKRIRTLLNNGISEFVVNNDGNPHTIWLFDSTQTININQLKAIQFPQINPASNYDYLIVSHPMLEPAATNYKDYRSQKYNTLKVYSEELYDYYFYGNKHPLAIRRFIKHLVNEQVVTPGYLLLAGRGYQNDKARFYSISSQNPIEYYNKNLVPGIGVPGADALYSFQIKGDGFYAEVPTGRISASNNQELQNYLNKVIAYETNPDSIQSWRKNVLHVSGGSKESEQTYFRAILNYNANVIKNENLGARVSVYGKSTNTPTQDDLKERIVAEQNAGVNMVSFLGHASLTILDVDIGNVDDLNNTNKYPFYYFSGCNVGNATEVDPQTGGGINAKNYICTANKGGIGWLAHSNFTFDGFLPPIVNNFYAQYTQVNYGASIGKIMYEVTKMLSNNNVTTKSHNIQWVLQGDPAVTIYSPSAPDYTISNSDVFVQNSSLSIQDEFIDLGFMVNNNAKTSLDSFSVSVSRRLPNNQLITYPSIRCGRVFNKDTFYLRVETLGELALGNNVFEFRVDANNEVQELFENNNTSTVNLFIPGNGCTILYPQVDGVVGSDTVWLTVQNNNVANTQNEFIIEVDLAPDFTSPQKINSGVVRAGSFLQWPFKHGATDTTTYYWRARLNLTEQQGGRWVNGVFTYISGHEEAWMQRTFARVIDLTQSNLLQIDSLNKRIDFSDNSAVIDVRANRIAHGARGLFYEGENQNPGSLSCVSNGFFAITIDKRTLRMFINPRFPMNCANVINNNNNPSLRKLYYYGFPNSPTGQADFQRFVDSLDAGTYVAIWSVYDNGNTTWSPQMRNAFAKLGSIKVANANNPNAAFSMVGIAGAPIGSIAEDTLSLLTADTNAIANTVLYGKWFTGNGTSKIIGPAISWKNIGFKFSATENDGNDHNKISVIGVNNSGVDTLIIDDAVNEQDLSFIDASIYPYLKLKFNLFDTTYRTPDQVYYWSIRYTPAPEGTISIADGYNFHAANLDQGDSLKLTLAFKNVSKIGFDSIPVYMRILDQNRVLKYAIHKNLGQLLPEQVVRFSDVVSTYNLSGQYALEVYFNDGPQSELTKVNNYLFKSFVVKGDNINPHMDVTFDGYRIVSGDFVSPTPTIRITSKDDSKFKLQTDTSSFVVFLRKPSDLDFERLNISSPELRFIAANDQNNKATLEYKPTLTEEGIYTLKVLSKDASGNIAGSDFYEVDFNMQKKSTITNFFPYPNPATTNVKFVFTLTGAAPPDQLLIRIMTISGKIVKEITKDEFGPIKIGQNMSEYSWDGTDNFGDRLANGVYLYQVLTRINGNTVEKRQTAADNFFVENVGKIYLMK